MTATAMTVRVERCRGGMAEDEREEKGNGYWTDSLHG